MAKIVVIEDTDVICDIVVEILTSAGYEVFGARTGADGIRQAMENHPDLIICDIMMPNMDGYQVLGQVRSEPTMTSVPFIFLTAKAEREDIRQGMNLGADDYLVKPFKPDDLLSSVASRLRRQQAVIQRLSSQGQNLLGLPTRIDCIAALNKLARNFVEGNVSALLYLDIDRFRNIKQALGHTGSYELLREIANRLQESVRTQDRLFHFGEDKFVMLVNHLKHPHEAADIAARLLNRLRLPIAWQTHSFHVTAGIGISVFPTDGTAPEDLLLHGELALREAKEIGRSHFVFYEPAMRGGALDRLILEGALHEAVEEHGFHIHYQPQINLKTGRVFGVEALLRWNHAKFGPISPGKFIPVAEETRMILQIGEWVLKQACLDLVAWQALGHKDLRVAVNISGQQIRQPGLLRTIERVLEETGANPQDLELEMTESVIMNKPEEAIRIFKHIQSMGMRISIDDFGTGYSSLSYLKRFPINTLKIDQSFVRDINGATESGPLAAAIISMAKSLGIESIAEGVETADQVAFLRKQRCDGMQGFYFSRPIPSNELLELLKRQPLLQEADLSRED